MSLTVAQVGAKVTQGDVLLVLEAMKVKAHDLKSMTQLTCAVMQKGHHNLL